MRHLIYSAIFALAILCVRAQRVPWTPEKFVTVENLILASQEHLSRLLVFIQKERQNQFPNSQGGHRPPPGFGAGFQSFFADVQSRLEKVENTTRLLAVNMRLCPDQIPAPTEPKNVKVQPLTKGNTSTIIVSWDPISNPETSNLQYKVYFQALEPDGSISQREVVFKVCDPFQTQASITDLNPHARYRIKVGIVDGTTVESHSAARTVKTPDITPSKPEKVRAAKTGVNFIDLEWEPPRIRGEIIAYYVYYNDTYTGYRGIKKVVPAVTRYTLTNLTEETDIQVTVSAESDNGESDMANRMTFTTRKYTPPTVRYFRVTAVNQSCVKLDLTEHILQRNYDYIDVSLIRGTVIRGYEVRYTDFMNRRGKVDILDINQNVTFICGLDPNVGYYFAIVTFSRRSRSLPTPHEYAKTKGSVPSRVRDVRCQTLRNDPPMIRLSWKPPRHRYSARSPTYLINWGVKDGVFREEKIKNNSVTWFSDYLDDDLFHLFEIYAKNSVGESPPVQISLKTPKRNFTTPDNIQVNRIKNTRGTRLLVSWDKPRNPKINKYRILYRTFQWVYQGRWAIKEVDDPHATNVTIPIENPSHSYIVVARGVEGRPGANRRYVRDIKCHVNYNPVKKAKRPSPATGAKTGPSKQYPDTTGASRPNRGPAEPRQPPTGPYPNEPSLPPTGTFPSEPNLPPRGSRRRPPPGSGTFERPRSLNPNAFPGRLP